MSSHSEESSADAAAKADPSFKLLRRLGVTGRGVVIAIPWLWLLLIVGVRVLLFPLVLALALVLLQYLTNNPFLCVNVS